MSTCEQHVDRDLVRTLQRPENWIEAYGIQDIDAAAYAPQP